MNNLSSTVIRLNKKIAQDLLLFLVYSIFALFLNIVFYNIQTNYENWINKSTIIILLLLLLQTVVSKILFSRLFSLEYFFSVLVFIFYFGQNILLSIGYNFSDLTYSIAYRTYGLSTYILAIKYTFSCVSCSFGGIILIQLILKNKVIPYVKESNSEINSTFGKILLLMSLPIEGYTLLSKLIAMLNEGYKVAQGAGADVLSAFFSATLFASIIILMLSSKLNIKKCKYILLSYIAYQLFYMLTGQRALSLIRIVVIVYIYYHFVGKINFKSVMKTAIVGVVILYLLIIIRNSRVYGLSLSSLSFTVNGNILFDMISEFGITIKVITAAFARVNEFMNGKSIICGFLAVIPGWSDLFGDNLIEKYYTYVALGQQAWGSSFVSDLYFDFNFTGGIFASGIYGMIIGGACFKLNSCLTRGIVRETAIWSYVVVEMIFTIRSYIFRLPRYFLYFLLIYQVGMLISNGYKRNTSLGIVEKRKI